MQFSALICTNEWNSFVDRVAGDKAGGEFFEKSKRAAKSFEPFLAGQPNQRASGDHYFSPLSWSVPVVSLAALFSHQFKEEHFARKHQIKELFGMRLKLVFAASLLAAVVGAGSCIALVLGVFSRQALSSPGLLVSSTLLLPMATIIFASIFVYRHTARRRRLQAF